MATATPFKKLLGQKLAEGAQAKYDSFISDVRLSSFFSRKIDAS